MTVKVLDTGNLSPQQILLGTLNDPGFAEVADVIVIYRTAAGVFGISHSNMSHAHKALAALLLADVATQSAKGAA